MGAFDFMRTFLEKRNQRYIELEENADLRERNKREPDELRKELMTAQLSELKKYRNELDIDYERLGNRGRSRTMRGTRINPLRSDAIKFDESREQEPRKRANTFPGTFPRP